MQFQDVAAKAGLTAPNVSGPERDKQYIIETTGCGVALFDYDNDGWPDIYLACDSTPNILFHNEGNGTFTDIGLLSGTAVNEDGQEQAGMGIAAGDYDHDGLIDLVKTNFADDTPTLYRNLGKNLFTDATYPARLGVSTRFLDGRIEFSVGADLLMVWSEANSMIPFLRTHFADTLAKR